MQKKKHAACAPVDFDLILNDIQSPDEAVRARAVRSLCPCRSGWELFEQHRNLVDRLRKDPSPLVRANALHIFEDADEMDNGGYPTNPREVTNEMLRNKRQARFRPEAEEGEARNRAKTVRRGTKPR